VNYQQCIQTKEDFQTVERSMRTDEQQCLSMKTVLTVWSVDDTRIHDSRYGVTDVKQINIFII